MHARVGLGPQGHGGARGTTGHGGQSHGRQSSSMVDQGGEH